MSKRDTKPNIKRVIADTFGTGAGVILSSAIATGTIFAVMPDTDITLPDTSGSAMEESITAQHQANFSALQEIKSNITLLEAETSFTGGSTELTELKTAFGKQAVAAYMDLYLEGARNDGAALSEENFANLRKTFAEEIANPAEFGFQKHISAAMLDETLAKTDLNTQNSADRFETAQQIDQALATALDEESRDRKSSTVLPLVLSAAAFSLLLLLSSIAKDEWEYEPRRVPRKKPKKNGPYGGH